MKKLTKEQWYLYFYLEHKSNLGEWTKRKKILEDLSDIYNYQGEEDLYYSTSAVKLTKDIRAINESDEDKLIISNSRKGVKMGTREETIEQLNKEKIALLKQWKRWHEKVKKANLDGQVTIDGNVIESFIKDSGYIVKVNKRKEKKLKKKSRKKVR